MKAIKVLLVFIDIYFLVFCVLVIVFLFPIVFSVGCAFALCLAI